MTESGRTPGLTADRVARRGVSFDWLSSGRGQLHWVADIPEIGYPVQQSWARATGRITNHAPRAAGVGSALHAYGGTPYAVGITGHRWLVSSSGSQVWASQERLLTDTEHQYGDLHEDDDRLFAVRENDVGDELVLIRADDQPTRVLRAVDGFLATPRSGADQLAWVQWDRAVMPWDSSEVWVGREGPAGLADPVRVAGGPQESAVQPRWGPDGLLYFMSDRTGWWNLYRHRDGRVEAVAVMSSDCAAAPWESSYSSYAFLPAGRIAVIAQNGPLHRLLIIEAGCDVLPVDVPYTTFKPHLAVLDERVAVIGASPSCAPEIVLVSTDGSGDVEVVADSFSVAGGSVPSSADRPLEPEVLSVPDVVRISSGDADVTVLFYPPTGRRTRDDAAPLIVRPHPGPTYNNELRLNWEVQFFTSRGFAVVEVDYRGSTGYGRAFRKALDGQWGTLDVEDCRNAAHHFLQNGAARSGAVFISGASAGGYTALRAVCQEGPFALAVARSAIVDPQRWTLTAPRFQRPHAAILSHDQAAVDPGRVKRPVLLVHGDVDPIAPFEDTAELAHALRQRGLLAGMLRLPGVGHYVSSPPALIDALNVELAAYEALLTP